MRSAASLRRASPIATGVLLLALAWLGVPNGRAQTPPPSGAPTAEPAKAPPPPAAAPPPAAMPAPEAPAPKPGQEPPAPKAASPKPAPSKPAPSKPAPSKPAPQPVAAVPAKPVLDLKHLRPRTGAELTEALDALSAAGDTEGLLALCRGTRPSQIAEDPSAAVRLAMCRGRAAQELGDLDQAAKGFQEVLQLSGGPMAALEAAQAAAGEARFRMAEVREQRWRNYPLCLRQLGIFWGSRSEAQEKIRLFQEAELAFRDAMPGARRPWPQRAAFRIAALHMEFYRNVADHTAPNFRGLAGPPPLGSAGVGAADAALKLVLDPTQSDWPMLLRDVADAAAQRASDSRDDPDLREAAALLARQASQMPPPRRAPLASPFPERHGRDRGWLRLVAQREVVLVVARDGSTKREPVLAMGKTLVEVVQGGAQEVHAPAAAVVLGLAGYRAALPVLREAALATDPELAVASVFALGELGGAKEIALLLQLYAQAMPPGDGPAPFETPSRALFGMQERVEEALIKIARREPRAFEGFMLNGLPPREGAYVLSQAAHKDLRYVHAQYARHPDDVVAAYHALALAAIHPREASAALRELARRPQAQCWAEHAMDALKERRNRSNEFLSAP